MKVAPSDAAPTRTSASAPRTATVGALELSGRWRRPPGRSPYLETALGPVRVEFSEGVPAPGPGVPVTCWARFDVREPPRDAGRAVRVVRWEARGPVSGVWLDRWSSAAGARIEHLVSPTRRGVVAALLLGDRSDVPPSVKRDAVSTGTAHLFALSGMHVVLVAGFLGRALRGLGLRGASGIVAQGLLLAGFAALAGLRPPLLRASLGWILWAWSGHVGRRMTGLYRLGVVALALLITSPGMQHELSAQLSFAAVAGLIVATRRRRGGLAWALAPIGAFLATAPLAAEVFGRVQPWGVVVTPLLLPLVAALLLVGLVAVLPGTAGAALDTLTGPWLEELSGTLAHLLERLASWLPPPWTPPPPALPGWLLSCGVVLALWCLSPRAEPRGTPARPSLGDVLP